MDKYWQIISTEFQRQLTYRMEVYAWRIGTTLEIGFQIVLWTILFAHNTVIRGYTYPQMLTYVVIGWFLTYFTINYQLEDMVARDIKDGTLSNFLTKPMSYRRFIFLRSVGRSTLSLTTAICIQIILIFLLRDNLLAPASTWALLLIPVMVLGSYCNRFLCSLMMGAAAFWTTETNGLFHCLRFVTNFLSGALVAINLLPPALAQFCLALPFVYFYYVPTQLYLGTVTLRAGVIGLGIQIVWGFILFGLTKLVWSRGLRRYEGVGI